MELHSHGDQHQHSLNTSSRNTLHRFSEWCSIPVLGILFGTRNDQGHNCDSKHNHNVGDRHNLCIHPIKCLHTIASALVLTVSVTPVYAEGDVAVTAVAKPQATSTGSVTNQAVQVLQGPYVTNSYGGGVSCQGPTFNLTPFYTTTHSGQRPYEEFANLDNDPTTPLERTGQKDNFSGNFGISGTISIPLDGGLQERCKAAAEVWTNRQRAETDKARLDFELVRLLRCGEAMKAGIHFNPQSPYAKVCSDVVVVPANVRTAPVSSSSVPSGRTSQSSSSVPVQQQSQPVTRKASDLGGDVSLPGRKSGGQ